MSKELIERLHWRGLHDLNPSDPLIVIACFFVGFSIGSVIARIQHRPGPVAASRAAASPGGFIPSRPVQRQAVGGGASRHDSASSSRTPHSNGSGSNSVPNLDSCRPPPLGSLTSLPWTEVVELKGPYAESNRLQLKARELLRSGDVDGADRTALAALTATPARYGGPGEPMYIIEVLLGDIRLRQCRYEEALRHYLPARNRIGRYALDLDAALCCVRLEDYKRARLLFSNEVLRAYFSGLDPADLPGTKTLRELEATILMARGADAFRSCYEEVALENFEAAARVAPHNGLAACWAAESLDWLGRPAEAVPYWRRAARYGRGEVARKAKKRLASFKTSSSAGRTSRLPWGRRRAHQSG